MEDHNRIGSSMLNRIGGIETGLEHFDVIVPDGIYGPALGLVWCRLTPHRNDKARLIGRIVSPGAAMDGKVIHEEHCDDFVGEEGQLALVAVSRNFESYSIGYFASIIRVWQDGSMDRLLGEFVVTAATVEQAETMLRKELTRAKFNAKRVRPALIIESVSDNRLLRTVETCY